MKNLFRFLGGHKLAILVITCLLAFQAYCDLALPTYTSDILNIGLQSSGIKDAVPETLREESLTQLGLFLSDEQAEELTEAYTAADADGICTFTAEDRRDEIADLLLVPEAALYQLSQSEGGTETLEQMQAAVTSGVMTKEALQEKVTAGMEKMGDSSSSLLSQSAVQYVSQEYQAQGIDLTTIRDAFLWSTGGKMLLLAVLMTVVSLLAGLIASVTGSKIGRDLRNQLFEKVMNFSVQEVNAFSQASLITRCTNDIQQIQMVTVMLLRMVLYAPILSVAGIIMVIRTGSQMSWIIVMAVIVMAVVIAVLFGLTLPKFKIMQSLVDKLNLVSREMLTGVMPVRAFNRQDYEEKRFEKANTDLFRTQLFTNRVMNFLTPTMMFVMNGVSVLIVWVGGFGVDDGSVQIGDLTAFITYSMVIIMGFMIVSMISILLPRSGVAADRVREVLDMEISLQDPVRTRDAELDDAKGQVRFENVSFTFPDAEKPLLQDISFCAEPGKTTAIIGSTGCGKSTLLHLILRFYDVTGGRVLVDGVDIREISQKKLRSLIGYAPQKGVLFSGTVETNLKYSGPEVSDDRMREAAGIAQAEEFISEREQGFGAPIAQNGTNVSGGQRQRLSIARAIAKDPKIYLFDDSFSALDYKTDLQLRTELARKTKEASVIIVAQRIATILHADQILVMDNGRLMGIGTHEELLRNCETYMEIARGQLSEAEIRAALEGGEADGSK